ncbi:hypothetical protein ACAG25_16290 [Mycobacterium sp. pV006]|uniref:hypothetical protein n=1 Tax=Mycobacterium sp. pV006 TaxID=3238983 RepID=UPI00351BC734
MPPDPQGPDPLAIAALVVSICSATVTLFGLVWQLTLYKLQGSRLKVEIAFCYLTDFGMTVTLRGPGRRTPTFADLRKRHDGLYYGIEYGLVRVTNIGRTPVSVENISFDLGRLKWWRLGRSTIIPASFQDPDTDTESNFDSQSPHRIEVGANVTAAYHLWPALAGSQTRAHRGNRNLVVRGSATAVGRKATRSSRRSAWRFPAGATSWFSDLTPPPPDLRVYRRLWLGQRVDHVGGMPLLFHREITEMLAAGASDKDLKEFLDRHRPEGIHGLLAYETHHAYHSAAASIWSAEPQHRPRQGWRKRLRRVLWGVDSQN